VPLSRAAHVLLIHPNPTVLPRQTVSEGIRTDGRKRMLRFWAFRANKKQQRRRRVRGVLVALELSHANAAHTTAEEESNAMWGGILGPLLDSNRYHIDVPGR